MSTLLLSTQLRLALAGATAAVAAVLGVTADLNRLLDLGAAAAMDLDNTAEEAVAAERTEANTTAAAELVATRSAIARQAKPGDPLVLHKQAQQHLSNAPELQPQLGMSLTPACSCNRGKLCHSHIGLSSRYGWVICKSCMFCQATSPSQPTSLPLHTMLVCRCMHELVSRSVFKPLRTYTVSLNVNRSAQQTIVTQLSWRCHLRSIASKLLGVTLKQSMGCVLE